MPEDDLLYPPAQYGAVWVLLVFGIIVTAILLAVVVNVLTKPRRLASQPTADPAAVLTQLRVEYRGQIDEIERRAQSGDIDPRRAHAEISRLMRAFVNEYSGLEAPVLTLRDLVAMGVNPALIDALRTYTYPSVFRRGTPLDPALAAKAARQVVDSWH